MGSESVDRCPKCKRFQVCKIVNGEYQYYWKQLDADKQKSLETHFVMNDVLCDKCATVIIAPPGFTKKRDESNS